MTKINTTGDRWLKEHFDIDINTLQSEVPTLENFAKEQSEKIKYINDDLHIPPKKPKILKELNIDPEILDAIYFHKGVIVSELKSADKKNTIFLKKPAIMDAFLRTNIHPGLSAHMVKRILDVYSPQTDLVEYIKFMTNLIKDIKSGAFVDRSTKVPSRPNSTMPATRSHSENKLSLTMNDKKSQLEDVIREIKTIKIIYPQLKRRFSTYMDQKISINEFANLLREFSIIYPKQKLERVISYLELDPAGFSMQDFDINFNRCKILASELTSHEVLAYYQRLKDILYTLGGRDYIFGNKSFVSRSEFVSKLKDKVPFTPDIIEAVYHYMTKTDRNLTVDDYEQHFIAERTNEFDEEFSIKVTRAVNDKISKSGLKPNEYFDLLLSYKHNRSENRLNRVEFHKAMTIEKFGYTAEELDYIFDMFDKKKDEQLDRDEFNTTLKKVHQALFQVQDVIKKNALEIEDLMHRMHIDAAKNERLDFYKFKAKIKLLDSTFSHEFIQSLWGEMTTTGTIDTKTLIDYFNVFKKQHFRNTNNESFRLNFIEVIKRNSNFSDFKSWCEKIDSYNTGLLERIPFCNIVRKITTEYQDEDIMKFIRITNLFRENKIDYPAFLDYIFYQFDLRKDTNFNDLLELLRNLFKDNQNDILALYAKLAGTSYKKTVGKVYMPENDVKLSIDQVYDYLKKNSDREIQKNIICKLDLDHDGRISLSDLRGVFDRFIVTSYFKHENTDNQLECNLYPKDQLDEPKFKQIVKDILTALKAKNLTVHGLFNKLDTNKDGFVSHTEFNKNIDEVISLAPSLKDQFYNTLDVRQTSLVDLDTFLKRFKEFTSVDVVIKNNWEVENAVLSELKKWVKKHSKLNENEIFTAIDYNCDGSICLNDFKRFLTDVLYYPQYNLNNYKLERVLQHISLTKNKNIGLADIKDFLNNVKYDKLKDINEEIELSATNFNLKKSQDWINAVVEKLGLYISEHYEDLDTFFQENSHLGKFTIQHLQNWLSKHLSYLDGINLTPDEVVVLYTALDAHKKSFLNFDDVCNKLGCFNFYKKMHYNIKDFLRINFVDSIAAFKYFSKSEDYNSYNLSKKELFDCINNIFPGKYKTNTILRYLDMHFTDSEKVSYSEFNFIYFDDVKDNDELKGSYSKINRVFSSRSKELSKPFFNKSGGTARAFSAQHAMNNLKKLATPYDEDPLEKLRRLISSSKLDFTQFFKLHEMVNGETMNQMEFRNMIKNLNIGLTNLEIDYIISRLIKTGDGKVYFREFIKFATNQ
jgi:Ca2+-binding EF-hand superfamily protein